ncbi:GPW/gp25 family protein [Yinghuangia seranimata]|uniref:GPW/gp25 family protein n=1 Tax=Yinghuangia seranimata TaxID=408067 RepID=UPI00248C1F5F|nr:GPW/gp25 family protein [Yinghuangia seranimata]MDI2131685.1 hypothetical protein [Yinghuangia seranimata]
MTTPSQPARHPYRLTPARLLATGDEAGHVADMVRLVLLTGPWERVHRPDFGAGLGSATVFEPLGEALPGIVEMRVRGSLEEALGDRVELLEVRADAEAEATIAATVVYRLKATGETGSVALRVEG